MDPTALFVFATALLVAAARARTMFANPRAMQLLNRTGGTMLAGAALAVAAK
jgi:threonine/homoserine/homoserine lactone efflux protein